MSHPAQPLAVLAHACRFPGADSPEVFWQNLTNGIASIRETPPERWSVDQLYVPPPYQPGKSITKWGAFLADIQRFDAAFFNIPAAEAQVMDPQQRILLELAYETLERAGYDANRRQGMRIGVFLGIGQNGYSELTVPLLLSGQPTHPMLVANNIRNLVAGQIAHSLNLTGPALVVDTACSSSLVALHLARQSLLSGECELALVGGINLNITATPFVAFSSAGVLAATPHSYVFDERANGFVLGEGGGMLLLSTLSYATAAADPMIGLIRGSAINNDGHSLGTMTPSPNGQEAVLRAAYATAAIPPETITYIEAHATGTRIGDVIEARALTRCFPKPPHSGVRYLGAVKPNVGHLLSAAAMPSLVKVLLAFQHQQLPPTLHCEQVRPIFKLDQAGFVINRDLIDWTPAAPGLPLRAGISSFGFGGTNAHVVLEAPPVHAPRAKAAVPYAFAQTPYWVQRTESQQQRAEERGERREDRGQKREDRGERTEERGQRTENHELMGEGLADGVAASVLLPPVEPGVETWLQRITWAEAPLQGKSMAQRYRTWLVLAVATPETQALAERLSHHLQGQGFPCTYHCCQPDDEAALEHWLAAQEPGWGLVFMGAVGSVSPLYDQTALAAGLANGIFSFHRVAQRLATSPAAHRPAGIWVVTAGAYVVENATEAIAPDRAALAGFAFALHDELVKIHCQVVDLALSTTVDFHLAQVAAELAVEPERAIIAWRQRQGRWTRLVRQLSPLPTPPSAPIPLRLVKGVYLITGGATGIGAAIAQSLASLGMTLVLTGRTPLPRDAKRAALVMALRKAGATVEYIVTDITQANEVAVLLEYICQLYGPPAGVIHAAGIVRPQSLRHKSQADTEAVLAPKVLGAWLLAQELQRRGIEPAYIVLFSSIASILPGFAGGLSDYAAANAFLDALAASERQQGRTCTVINWSIWGETGMGAQPAVVHHLAAQGVAALTTAEGIGAFYRALAVDEGQIVVYKPQSTSSASSLPNAPQLGEGNLDNVTVPPTGWGRLGGGEANSASILPSQATDPQAAAWSQEYTGHKADEAEQVPQPSPTPSIVTTRKTDEIEKALQALLATVLKVAPAEVAKSASFMNLGIDSMDALDLVQKLETAGFPGLPATLFFEYQTIADLAQYLANQPSKTTAAAASAPNTPDRQPVTRPGLLEPNDSSITLSQHRLSPIQRAFAINHLLYPERPAVAFLRQSIRGAIQINLLQQAVRQVAARHPLLRTRFTVSNAPDVLTPTVCAPDEATTIPTIATATDLTVPARFAQGFAQESIQWPTQWPTQWSTQWSIQWSIQWEDDLVNRPFDLAIGSPWRVALLRDPDQPDQWQFLLAIHHIAGDAWSLSLVAHEIWSFYTALCQGRTLELPMPPSPYQAQFVHQPPEPTALIWWRQQVVHYASAPPLRLPFDHDPAGLTPDEWAETRYAAHATRLTTAQSAALSQLAAAHNLSLFHLVLALYLRTIQGWTQAAHLVVNVADAQRPPHQAGIMAMVGSFADALPLGVGVEPTESLFVLAERIRQNWLTIQQHKAVSTLDLRQIQTEIAPREQRQPEHLSPLGFSFARFEANPPVDCPVNIVEIFGRTATPTMRLTLVGWEFAGELHFSWNYVTPIFQPATIEALAVGFVAEVAHLLSAQHPLSTQFASAPQSPIPSSGKVDNDDPLDPTDLPGRLTERPALFVPITTLVQTQCQRTPDAIAVWEQGNALTYDELAHSSSQIATAIHTLNDEEAPVGLLANPSTAAVQLLLGISNAGAAWVPLDPAHPPARHADQLAQAGVRLLVFPSALTQAAEAIRHELSGAIQLYSLDDLTHHQGMTCHAPTLRAEQIAYIIFTSGSTGHPKGVPITHGALANYIGWAVDTFGYGSADRVMQATSLCFDASIRQIFAPLATGGTVMPVERGLLSDPPALLHFLQENRITIWSSAPALWARLIGALEGTGATTQSMALLPDLRWVQVGGEALSAQLVRRWYDLVGDRQCIANLYGPTETTINATCYIVPGRPAAEETQMPIGYPVRGAQLLVCDTAGQPCPVGAVGELWIGGIGLSPGYLGDEQRTQERFVFMAVGASVQRFYRSGDRVQQGTDGALRFLGRLDEQVKVRGYRIELGEIETILSQHPNVRLAAVVTRPTNPEEQMLVAYLECANTPPTEEAVREWLQRHLPDYMLPHQIYATPRLPQMPNGKIDRQGLGNSVVESRPLPRAGHRSAPQTPTEQLLAQAWRAVLPLNNTSAPIAREDDFFALGGDSLRAIQLFVELGKVRSSLPRATYLYRYRTLAALAQALDAHQPNPTQPPGLAHDELWGVSLAQAGFLLARALHETQATTWCARFWLEGPLQVEPFVQAVQVLVKRHAMLRAIFPTPGKERSNRSAQQRILQPERPLPVAFTDLQALTPAEQQSALDVQWQQLRARQFDPAQWPLIEMHLCRLTPTAHLWLVATDHLIGDGLSGWLLGRELLQSYDALVAGRPPVLPPLRSSFRDYVVLQQRHEQQPDPAAEQYWRQIFATPYQPPKRSEQRKGNDGGWVQQSIDLAAAAVTQLENKATIIGVTPYELLLTLFFRQLQRLTGQRDLIVGSALAGRDEPLPDIMRLFGAFAMALPLRVQLVGETREENAQQVAQAFQTARAHTLSPRRIAQVMHPQTPLVAALGAQFLFSYMDFSTLGSLHSETLQVRWDASQTELQPPSYSADLVLTGRKLDGQLRLTFTAPAAAMSVQALQTFVAGFAQEIHEVTNDSPSHLVVRQDALSIAAPPSAIHFQSRPLDESGLAAGAAANVDTALIGYLPPFAQIQSILEVMKLPFNADDVRQLIFPEHKSRWLEALTTPLGRSGLIAIPRFADELSALPNERLVQEIQEAIAYAATLGARCVSLAGMLPAYTRYGYALLNAATSATQPALTTGHSTTVVAVVKTVQAALAATQQDLATLHVGCLGVGSIGSGVLQLLLTQVGHPAALTLCDLAGSGDRLTALAAELRHKFDYQGQVRIIEGEDCLPAPLYEVDLLISATSRPNLVEVTRLKPGSLVVDDSFPACLDLEQAIARMKSAQDLLVVGGGLLHCGPLQRTFHLPLPHPALGQQIAGQLHADAVASCQLEALLWAKQPDLPLTHGVARVEYARQYWAAAEAAQITAAPLHLRDFRVTEALLQRVKAIRNS